MQVSLTTSRILIVGFTLLFFGLFGVSQAEAGITFVGASVASTTGDTVSPSVPADARGGDFMLATCTYDLNNTNLHESYTENTAGGWTLLYDKENESAGRDFSDGMFYKFHDGSEIDPDFDNNDGLSDQAWSCMINSFRGVDPINPFDVDYDGSVHSNSGQDDPTPPNQSLTTVTDNTMPLIFGAVSHDDITAWDAPGSSTWNLGSSIAGNNYDGGAVNYSQQGLAYRNIYATAGTLSPGDWENANDNTRGEWAVTTLALREAVGLTVSGTLYENDRVTALGAGLPISLALSTPSTALFATTTEAGGVFSFEGISQSTVGDWTKSTGVGASDRWHSVAYGTSTYVAVADCSSGTTDCVMTSPDGITWTARSAAGDDDDWRSVTYGEGLFVAVGESDGGADDVVMTSSDGITWATTTAAGDDDDWQSVTYGNGVFIAVGDSNFGANTVVMTSSDGTNWTARNAEGDNDRWQSVTYGDGTFVAVGKISGSADVVMYSTNNGGTWISPSAAGNNDDWYGVTYGDGLFVAVADSLGDDVVITSTDGITWTARSAADDDDDWQSVTYGNGTFVAVSYTGDDEVMTSTDGTRWSTPTAQGSFWRGIVYSTSTEKFVAVAETADPVMYADALFGEDTPITVWVDDSATTSSSTASTLTYSINNDSGTTTLDGIDLYTDTVLFKNATGSEAIDLSDADFYDGADNSSILFESTSATTTVDADIYIDASTTLTAADALVLYGDYTNSGSLTASTSEVVFAGTAIQNATGTLNGSSAFYDLTISNVSQDGVNNQSVSFGTTLESTGTFTMQSSASAEFAASTDPTATPHTFNDVVWEGGSSESLVYLRSDDGGSNWLLDISGSSSVEFVDVSDSYAVPTAGGVTAQNSIDSFNNTNWFFGGAAAEWNSDDWLLYDTITIDNTNIDEDLTDFPVYVDLSDLSAQFWNTVISGGGDIRVTTDSNIEVAREVVSASTTANTGELHFKAPTISSTTDTTFRVWYNGSANDYDRDATYGLESVWSNEYQSVMHFEDIDTVTDSTGNARSATASGTVSTLQGQLSGQAFDFNGTDGLVALTEDYVLDSQDHTVQFWYDTDTVDPSQSIIASFAGQEQYFVTFGDTQPADSVGVRTRTDGGSYLTEVVQDSVSVDQWYQWSHTISSDGLYNLYVDGALASTSNGSAAFVNDNGLNTVGVLENGDGFERYFDGQIDEVRISSTTRSAAWIAAEYTNQSTTTDFYNTNRNETWNANEWTLYDTITIDNTNIDEDLTDFPVYVDLSDLSSQFWNTVTDGGGDIRVTTDSNVEVAREVVSASTTANTGELHFKASTISSTTDTTFRVWYNGSAGDYVTDAVYGAEGVWEKYAVVWHMNSLTQSDSAGNFIDATPSGDIALVDENVFLDTADTGQITVSDTGVSSFNDWSSMLFWDEDGATSFGSHTEGTAGAFRVQGIRPSVGRIEVRSGNGGVNEFIESAVQASGEQILLVTYDSAVNEISVYNNGVFVATSSQGDPSLAWDEWNVVNMRGTLYESRGGTTTKSAAFAKAQWTNFSTTTDFYNTNRNETWNANEWTLFDTITIDNTVIDEDLTDFPVYVDLSDLSSQFWNTVTDGGGDIRVTTDSNVEVPREVVSASTTAETGELHFKASAISSTTDTTFRVWYNGSANDYDRNATYGLESVWSNEYVGVWHLESALDDSTANTNDFTNSGTSLSSDSWSGGARDFDTDALSVALNLTSTDKLTVSRWVQHDALASAQIHQEFSSNYNSFTNGFVGSIDATTGEYRAAVKGNIGYNRSTSSQPVAGQYMHFVDVLDKSSSGAEIIPYIDGVADYTNDLTNDNTNSFGFLTLYMGSRAGASSYFEGQMDEVRLASTTRSAAWVAAEYTNQSTTTDFYSLDSNTPNALVTIDDHSVGQVDDMFSFANKTNEVLYAFAMGADSTVTVEDIAFDLTGIKNVDLSDFSNVRLYKDHDNDAAYDATDEQVGGTGVVTAEGLQRGVITFTTDFTATSTTNYVLVADWNAPERSSFLTVALVLQNITVTHVDGTPTLQGVVSTLQHSRNKSGGGGSSAQIGNVVVGNGTTTGGTNDGGELIGNDPNFKRPTANSGSWTNSENAYDGTDGTYATDNTGTTNNFTDHSFVIGGGNTIEGIEIKLEISGTTPAGDIGVELSWDGGTSWTSSKTTPTLSSTDAITTLGSPSDTWGRTWSVSEFSNANFTVRLTGNPSSNTVQVDELQVRVYHQASGGGGGGGGAI